MEAQTPEYRKGYQAAKRDIRRDLASALRAHMTPTREDDERPLTAGEAHEIFAAVFGVMAADAEFGDNGASGLAGKLAREC